MTDESQVNQMVADAVDRFGRLDTLVNNAGVMLLGPIVGAPTEEWRRMVNLNLLGLLYCTHAALPHLLDGGGERAPPRGRCGQRELGGRPGGPIQQWGLQRHQVRGRRLQRIAPPRGHRSTRAGHHCRTRARPPPSWPSTTGPRFSKVWRRHSGGIEMLGAEDIANAVRYAVTQPRRVAVNEILVRPTEQER